MNKRLRQHLRETVINALSSFGFILILTVSFKLVYFALFSLFMGNLPTAALGGLGFSFAVSVLVKYFIFFVEK